jgi:hypothetical protein
VSTSVKEPADATVELRIKLDDPNLRIAVEAFADGSIFSLDDHDGELCLGLRLPGAWPAAVSTAERQLDRLGIDWRDSMRLRRP